ncbi:hypothetical protein JCM33374_g269 [Metschnikowia sp. JCM 33374]|nr:hypothetical protein JCM33374_g269 [Metschnikowia sp. JCM 33374]
MEPSDDSGSEEILLVENTPDKMESQGSGPPSTSDWSDSDDECETDCSSQLEDPPDFPLTSETESLGTEEEISFSPPTTPPSIGDSSKVTFTPEEELQLDRAIKTFVANLTRDEYEELLDKYDCLAHLRTQANIEPRENKKQHTPPKPEPEHATRENKRKRTPEAGQDENLDVQNAKRPKRHAQSKLEFDYSKIKFENTVILAPQLQNIAKKALPEGRKLEESLRLYSEDTNVITRTRYHRDNLDCLDNIHANVAYIKNLKFDINSPYQQEFTRVKLDPQTGKPKGYTRSALCAYCEKVCFYELKTSCYGHHLYRQHGVFPDGYLTPNPLLRGIYNVIKKENETRKSTPQVREREAVFCPVCYELVETGVLSEMLDRETNPITNYLNHFNFAHRNQTLKEQYFNLTE